MTDRLRPDIDDLPTTPPSWLENAPTTPPRTEGKGKKNLNWQEAFEKKFGYKPEEFVPIEIKPVLVKSAVKGTFDHGYSEVIAPGVGLFGWKATADPDSAVRYIQGLPVGMVFGFDQTSLRDEAEGKWTVVFFKKLENGRLQPVRPPGLLRQREIAEDENGYSTRSSRDIADTVED